MKSPIFRFARSLGALVALGLASVVSFAAAAPKFPQETSDLAPDPTVKFGTLPNGLRYAVVANHEPKGRASLRLLVNAGSLNENDDQQGLAHFLEHMAFNGSTNYPPGTLVEFFQRMGMSFGGDTNASTSFDRTQYLLELADTKEATLAEGLRVLSDYSGGLLLQLKEIDSERGIILSEKRARDSVSYRSFIDEFDYLFGDTRLPKRIPIGQAEIIQNAPRERFTEFYNTWYRPELITVIAVGDFDASAVEKQIIAGFTGFVARAPSAASPELGKIAPAPGLHTHFHYDREAPSTEVSITSIFPYAHENDTAAKRLNDLPRHIANAILNQRFSILAKKEGAPFMSAHASVSESFDFVRDASVSVTCKADQWAAALNVGENELRRALEFGFQQGEIQEIVANYTRQLEIAVKTAPTRRSSEVADGLVSSIRDGEVFTSAEADLALFKPALQKLTPEDCLQALRKAWKADHCFVIVNGNAVLGDKAEEQIKAAYEKAHATVVSAPAKETAGVWGYSDFGKPGKVVKRQHIDDLDITEVTFENGVCLNIKKTDFTAGIISISARVSGGTKTEPTDKRGLAQLAAGTFDLGGLGKHSVDDLRRLLAGKDVGFRFQMDPGFFGFMGNTTPSDLLLQLQLLSAKLTDAGFRPEAMRQAQKGIEQMYIGFQHTANGPLALEVANLLASGDPRFGLPEKDVLLSRNLAEAKAWLQPFLSKAPLEVGVAGDLDIEATIEAASKTIGALPPREPQPEQPELLNVKFPSEPFSKFYSINSEIQKGLAVFYWPTTDGFDAHVTRRLNLLGSILSDRLRVKIREEMGGTYSPRASSFTSDTYPEYGYLSSAIDIAPENAAKIKAAVDAISADLAANGVNEDEILRAKQPILTSIRESVRTNAYWIVSVLNRAQGKPVVLDWARDRESDINGVTKAELDALARSYLPVLRISHVVIVPAPKVPAAPAALPAPAAPATPATH
jgi:zinc protease